MTTLFWNIVLGFAWAFATGELSFSNYLIGFAIGFVTLFLTRRVVGSSTYHRRPWHWIRFAGFFLKELVVANLRVAHDVITPRLHMRPAVVPVPLDAKSDMEIALLANLISLTPGTLSLDYSREEGVLYLHAMFCDDPDKLRDEIKNGIERRLLEALR
jgi:multicomponent Na+:H+ antiporter subunit E